MKSAYTQQSLIKNKLQNQQGSDRTMSGQNSQPRYHIDDLMPYTDVDFVTISYNTVLRRAPDADGHAVYLNKLAAGMPREEILFKLRYSSEGRAQKTRIDGLWFGTFMAIAGKVPLLGWLLQSLAILFTLPATKRRLQRLECSVRERSLSTDTDRMAQLEQILAKQDLLEAELARLKETTSASQKS
ncbi:MAG: DUF4214 domain-containing protein [Halioglobus sp.]